MMLTYVNAFLAGMASQNDVLVQPATKLDLEALAAIHAEGFARGWSDGDLEKMINNDKYFCLVAHFSRFSKKRPSGFVLVRSIADEAEIITVAIRTSARRRGLAKELMRAAIRQLEYDRVKRLFLEVDEGNTAAIALYKRLGFDTISERKGYYSSPTGDADKNTTALVMQLELG